MTLPYLPFILSLFFGSILRFYVRKGLLFICFLNDVGIASLFISSVIMHIDENLAPSMKFYIDALGDEGEAVALLKQRPVLFFYSLEHRLKPRLREARNAGLTIDSVLLKQLGGLTEKQWLASIEHHVKKQSEEILSA
mgnify:CR=1 FL=1